MKIQGDGAEVGRAAMEPASRVQSTARQGAAPAAQAGVVGRWSAVAQAMGSNSDVRQDKVDAVRQAVHAGTWRVDSSAVADKMLADAGQAGDEPR